MGFTRASWMAYSTRKGAMKASVSFGSSQRVARVTCTPHVMVPSGAAAAVAAPPSATSSAMGPMTARTRSAFMCPPEDSGGDVSDDAGRAQLVDLRAGDFEERGEDLVGVLTEERRGRLGRPRRVPEANGHPHGGDGARLGMRHLHEHAALAQVIALADLGHRLDAASGYPSLVEPLEPIGGGTTAELSVERGDQRVAVRHALRFTVEARVLREVCTVDGPAHALPEGVVGYPQGHVRVLSLEDFVGHDGRVLVPAPSGLATRVPVQPCLIRQEGG